MRILLFLSTLSLLGGTSFGQESSNLDPPATNLYYSKNVYVSVTWDTNRSKEAKRILGPKALSGDNTPGLVTIDLGNGSVMKSAYASVSDFLQDTVKYRLSLVSSISQKDGTILFLFNNSTTLEQEKSALLDIEAAEKAHIGN